MGQFLTYFQDLWPVVCKFWFAEENIKSVCVWFHETRAYFLSGYGHSFLDVLIECTVGEKFVL